jgi:gluconolactonase
MPRTMLSRIAFLSVVLLGCSSGGSGNEGAAGTNGEGGRGGAAGGVAGSPGQAGSGHGGSGVAGSGPAGSGGASSGVAGQPGHGGAGGSVGGAAGAATGTGGSGTGKGGGPAGSGEGGSGTGGGAAGSGAAGSSGGGRAYTCPSGSFTSPSGTLSPTKIAGVPPSDSFNNTGNDYGHLEGPVWLDAEQALFLSEISGGNNPPPSRVLKVTPTGTVSIAITDSGSNGLAVDGMGRLVSANHKFGAITVLSLTGAAPIQLIDKYMNNRFDSPNDLAIASDGTIYFSDPDWQAPSSKPQAKTRFYKLAPGATTATVIDENRQQPNGVTLSLDEKTVYLSAADGLYKYAIDASGTVGAGTRFANSISSGDGMTLDCAGNLYVAANSNSQIVVISPAGSVIAMGSVAGVTNAAFGGSDHKTLYLTAQGTSERALYKLSLSVPGMPY